MYIYPHCHPSPSTTAAFPSCTSHLPPILSFTAYVLAACLSLPLSPPPTPHDVVAVLPADSKDAGAAPPVPVAFADRPTAAPLASPTAVPPPAYSLPAAARAPRPDATRPAVVFAQNALPGAGTPVAATTTAGFQSYTCASTATPLQLNLPPSNLLLSSYTPSLHPHLHIFYIELHSSPNLSTRQYQLIGTVPLSLSRPPILSHIPLSLCPKWRCSLPGTVTISLSLSAPNVSVHYHGPHHIPLSFFLQWHCSLP